MLIISQKRERIVDLTGAAVEARDSYQNTMLVVIRGNHTYEIGYYDKERSREVLNEICGAKARGAEAFSMPEK